MPSDRNRLHLWCNRPLSAGSAHARARLANRQSIALFHDFDLRTSQPSHCGLINVFTNDNVKRHLLFQHTVKTTFTSVVLLLSSKNEIRKLKSNLSRQFRIVTMLILATAIGGRPKPELCFLPGRLRWTLLHKERYDNSLSGCGSSTQPSKWETNTITELLPSHLSWWCRKHSSSND